MGRLAALGVLAVLAAGCTHVQLQHRTVKQASTISDLQYQQVLNNLATFACDPEALPWHVTLGDGVVQITDVKSAGLAAEIPTEGPSLFLPSVQGERGVVGQWSIQPAVEADVLEHLRLAYQMAFRPGDPELRKEVYEAIGKLAVEFRVLPSEKTVVMIWKLFGQNGEDGENGGEGKEREKGPKGWVGDAAVLPPPRPADGEAEIRALYRAAREEAFLSPRERPKARKLLAMMHGWVVEGHIRLGPEEVVATHNLAEIEQVSEKIEKLQELLEKPVFQQPWLNAGCKKDVPKCACLVGCYCDCHKHCCCVWVGPDGRRALREFTLVILALAPPERQEIAPFGPVFSATRH